MPQSPSQPTISTPVYREISPWNTSRCSVSQPGVAASGDSPVAGSQVGKKQAASVPSAWSAHTESSGSASTRTVAPASSAVPSRTDTVRSPSTQSGNATRRGWLRPPAR